MMDIIFNEEYRSLLSTEGLTTFDSIMYYPGGECIKKGRGGSVYFLRLKDRRFYLKRYYTSFRDSAESLFRLKYITRDGLREWENISKVRSIGINTVTPVAAGNHRVSLQRSESFILTEDLYKAQKLDEFFRKNFMPPIERKSIRLKREIIHRAAHMVKVLHEKGMSHQDLYLGHFYIRFEEDGRFNLYLIDLQRIRESASRLSQERHRVKDLSQLLFASHYEVFVTNHDRLRFYKAYTGGRRLTISDRRLFDRILKRARRIAEHTSKHAYPLPAVSWQPEI